MQDNFFCVTLSSSLISHCLSVVSVVGQLDVADARGGELERPDRRAAVRAVRVDGQQVLERVALNAARLAAAVRHLKAWN